MSNKPECDEFQSPDGRNIALWRWSQSKSRPTLHWAHATGFHGRLYQPLLGDLATDLNVLAWDMRGHGTSAGAANISTFQGWETYYRDMIALLDSLEEPIWLAGHSIGATTSIMAAARRPDKVLGLILAEPVIISSGQSLKLWLAKLLRQSHRLPLAAGAARRRGAFDSYAAAMDNYRGRGAFKTWPEAWLESYVRYAFITQGTQIQLACSAEWESTTFAHTEHNPWPGIRELRCPVIALAAERGSTFSSIARKRVQALLPLAEVRVLGGTTHFLPMEQREVVRDAILSFVLSGSVR